MARPGSLSSKHVSSGFVLKWLCLASTYHREELLKVCKGKAEAKILMCVCDRSGSLPELAYALLDPKVI